MNTQEFDKLVKNIIKARKIQKDRIESNQESLFEENFNIEKMQKPVVQAISASTKQTLQSLEQQQNNMTGMLSAIENRLEESTGERNNPKWIQQFYKKYRTKTLTKMEINLDGTLGHHGYVDIDLMFNKGMIKLNYSGKKSHLISLDLMTLGLVGLLLLPYDDLKYAQINHPFEITNSDIEFYAQIMLQCGIEKQSKNSRKYKAFVKQFDDDDTEVVTSLTPQQLQRDKDRDEQISRKRFGLGVFHYNNPDDLEQRLDLLMGSLNAGNNSDDVRQEIRAILDKLLEIEYIPYTIHKKFYQKFNL